MGCHDYPLISSAIEGRISIYILPQLKAKPFYRSLLPEFPEEERSNGRRVRGRDVA
jgi:hypothetical protein